MSNKNYTEIGSRKKTEKYFLFTLILIVFHLISNSIWIFLNNVPPNWDPSVHIITAINYFEYLFTGNTVFNFINFLKLSNYYPIFTYLFSLPLVFLFSTSYKIILLTSPVIFSIAIFFLFISTAKLFKSNKVAFFSTLVFSFFITIFQTSREYMLDLPLTASILIVLFILYKLRNGLSIKYIYLLFLSLAITQSIKWYACIYLAIPIFFTILQLLKKKEFQKGKNYRLHLLFGIIIFTILTVPWYLANFETLIHQGSFAWIGESITRPDFLSLDALFFHLKLIIMFQTNFFGFLLFVVSIILIIKNNVPNKLELLLILIFNYLFFTFIPNRNIRYLIPLMPFFAMVMGYGISRGLESKKTIAIFSSVFIIIYYFFSYFILSFGIPVRPIYKYTYYFPLIKWVDLYYLADYPVKTIYDPAVWPQNEIIKDIKKDNLNQEAVMIFTCVDRYYLNTDNLRLFSKLKGINNFFFSSYNFEILNIKNENEIRGYVKKNNFSYALIPLKNVVGEDKNYIAYKPLKLFQEYFLSGQAENFKFVKEYPLPKSQFLINDSDKLLLFKRQ